MSARLLFQSIVAGALLVSCSALLDLAPLDFTEGPIDGGGDELRIDASDARIDPPDTGIDSGENDAGRAWRYVFVSSETRDGTLAADGGPSGRPSADAWCKTLAEKGLPVIHGLTWVAWLSTMAGPSNAASRIADAGVVRAEYRLLNETVVFPTSFTFDAGLPSSPIQLDEHGQNPAPRVVWTGSDRDGHVSSNTCFDWTSAATTVSSTIGTSTDINGWTVNPTVTQTCENLAHVYCFEAP